MRIPQFAMERMQSTWENLVDYNLSESGVHPMRLEELVEDPADRAGLLGQELVYPQSNGTIELRERVAAMYPGATADHVEVTNGGSEANFVTMWHLVEPGDEVVSMVPNYGQTLGLAEAFGGTLKPWALRLSADGKRWHTDIEDAAQAGDRQDAPHHPLQSEQPHRGPHPCSRPRWHLRGCREASARGCCRTRSTGARNWTAWKRRRCGAATSASSSQAASRRPTACRASGSAGS